MVFLMKIDSVGCVVVAVVVAYLKQELVLLWLKVWEYHSYHRHYHMRMSLMQMNMIEHNYNVANIVPE